MDISQQDHTLQPSQRYQVVNIDDSTTQFSRASQFQMKNQKQPTQIELCAIIEMMKKSMPKRSLEKAIMMMYDYQVKKKPPEKVFCDYIPPMSHIPQAYKGYKYNPNNRDEIVINYSKNQFLKTQFKNEMQQTRYKQKRQIAKSFVSKGYGAEIAQSFLRRANFHSTISKQNYKLIMSSIICQTFRKMEQFLIDNCNIKIKGLNKQQMASALTFIIKDNPNNQYLYIFKKFLRLYFALSQTTICEIQTVHCYLQIIKFIHNKRITIEGLQKYYSNQSLFDQRSESISATDTLDQENHKKTSQPSENRSKTNLITLYDDIVDQQIIKAFNQSKSLTGTAQIIGGIYPTWASFDKIKSKLITLTKTAIQRVRQQSQSQPSNFPKLQHLSDAQISIILTHNESQDIRSSLLDYYSKNAFHEDELFFLVEMINDFMDTIRSQPNQQMYDDKSLIGIRQ